MAPSVECPFLRYEPELRCEAPGTVRLARAVVTRVLFTWLRWWHFLRMSRFLHSAVFHPPFRNSAIFSFATEASRCLLPRLPQSLTCGKTVRGRGRGIFGLHVPTAPPPSATHSAFSRGSCCALLIDFCYPFPRLRVTTKRASSPVSFLLPRPAPTPLPFRNSLAPFASAAAAAVVVSAGGEWGVLVAFSQAPAAFTAAGSRRAPPRPPRRHFDVARRAASSSPRLFAPFVFARALLSQPPVSSLSPLAPASIYPRGALACVPPSSLYPCVLVRPGLRFNRLPLKWPTGSVRALAWRAFVRAPGSADRPFFARGQAGPRLALGSWAGEGWNAARRRLPAAGAGDLERRRLFPFPRGFVAKRGLPPWRPFLLVEPGWVGRAARSMGMRPLTACCCQRCRAVTPVVLSRGC